MAKQQHKHYKLGANIFSGFVVSLVALPLGLGLAQASGVPPIAGVITAIVGGIMCAILGGSFVTIMGPGNGLVVVTYGALMAFGGAELGYPHLLGAIIISGLLLFLFGLLKLGKLSSYFPASAIQGMLAAIGIIILSKQIHVMFGNMDAKGKNSFDLLYKSIESILAVPDSTANIYASIIGVLSLLIMFLHHKIQNQYLRNIPAPMWVLVLAVGSAYAFDFLGYTYPLNPNQLITLPEDIFGNIPTPSFSKIGESAFLSAVISLTLISSLESLLSIKAVEKLDPQKRRANTNKDLRAIGLSTIVSGFVGGLNVVAVIARSSVNVNNGGTNRFANLFHALFLVVFILLFSSQLEKVPMSALAAILVFTGYKLSAPFKFKEIFTIGKEQFIVFLFTVIGTLMFGLIQGIVIGIIFTVLSHIIFTKDPLLIWRYIFRPNTLMYKESDKYYISIKGVSNFLNFQQLKQKLDAISTKENVVLDFSLTKFVDHTVLEQLAVYTDTFEKSGGSFEILGLETLQTKASHPFAARRSFKKEVTSRNFSHSLTKRQSNLKVLSEKIGLDFVSFYEGDIKPLYRFLFFKSRNIDHLYNVIKDEDKQIWAFDIAYSEGEFILKENLKASMIYLKFNQEIPIFTLEKELIFDRMQEFAGLDDIKTSSDIFNKRFLLRGEKEEVVKAFFHDSLINFFNNNDYYHIESNGESLLIMKRERISSIIEIDKMLDFGKNLKKCIEQECN